MLVQTPSKILKSDYRFWDLCPNVAVADVYRDDRKEPGKPDTLYKVLEFVISKDSQNLVNLKSNQKVIFLPLYGKIKLNDFQKVIETGEVVVFESSENQSVTITNVLDNEQADVLVITFNKNVSENSYRINKVHLEIRNKLNFIETGFNFPGFIGVFDGREVGNYILKNQENRIFGMVINGAFEFQNRLIENRDAIIIEDIEELEFEALSENALIMFFEIP